MIQGIVQEPAEGGLDWEHVGPLLDAAMHDLSESDRLAILLRHFERRPLAEVGTRLGLSENAARMRVERALEKLRGRLAEHGVTSTASALALSLGTQAITAAPATLGASITAAALAAAATTTTTAGLFSFMASMNVMNLKAVGAAVLIASAGTAIFFQRQSTQQLRAENADLRQQLVQVASDAEAARRTASLAAAELDRLRQPQAELLRLRAEVARLRQQLAAVPPPAATVSQVLANPEPTAELDEEANKSMGIRRLNEAKLLVLGIHLLAGDNGDRYPDSLEHALTRVRSEVTDAEQLEVLQSLQAAEYEMMYHGSAAEIANPSEAIVVRQREAWRGPNGWMRTYGFADGHSEVHRSADGDYSEWEARHQVRPRAQQGNENLGTQSE